MQLDVFLKGGRPGKAGVPIRGRSGGRRDDDGDDGEGRGEILTRIGTVPAVVITAAIVAVAVGVGVWFVASPGPVEELTAGQMKVRELWQALAAEAPPPAGKITAGLAFDEALVPFTTEVYLASASAALWDTSTSPTTDASQIPEIGQPPVLLPFIEAAGMRGYYAFMEPGDEAFLAITVRNTGAEVIEYIAGPPQLEPYALYEGLIANCYCNGLTYVVPGDSSWVRVIRVAIRAEVPAGIVGLAAWPLAPGEEKAGTTPHDHPELGDWFDDVSNFEQVVDMTGQSVVVIQVGAWQPGSGGYFAFDLPAIEISSGTKVIWEWTGRGGGHNVVHQPDLGEARLFRSGDPVGGEGITFEYTFDDAGVYKYYCAPHLALGMKGAIIVV